MKAKTIVLIGIGLGLEACALKLYLDSVKRKKAVEEDLPLEGIFETNADGYYDPEENITENETITHYLGDDTFVNIRGEILADDELIETFGNFDIYNGVNMETKDLTKIVLYVVNQGNHTAYKIRREPGSFKVITAPKVKPKKQKHTFAGPNNEIDEAADEDEDTVVIPPYQISLDEFTTTNDDETVSKTETLYYFESTNTCIDGDDKRVSRANSTGDLNIGKLLDKSDSGAIYIRNQALQTDFEVVRVGNN